MPFADVNGIKMHYEVLGDGYSLILHHGYGANMHIWMGQIKALSEHFKVITLDSRSSGKTERPKEAYTLDTLVDDLKGLMDALGIQEAHLMGQSMGGWIIQNFVLKYPDKANKLVLLGTNHKGAGIHLLEQTMGELYELRKTAPEEAFRRYAKLMHHRRFFKEMQADPKKKFHDLWSAEDLIKETMEDQMTPEDLALLANAIDAHDLADRLHKISNPILLICASNDKMSPKLVMEEMDSAFPNSKLEFVDKTGHHLFLEEAPTVNNLIINFLKS